MKLVSLVAVFVFSLFSVAQERSGDPNQWVRHALENELQTEERDNSHWMFILQTKTANHGMEIDQVAETEHGDLKRPVVMNGRKLPASESDKRVQQLLHDQHALQKSISDKNADTSKSQQLLKMLPDAFRFKFAERQGDLVRFTFSPNPTFKPPTREAQVFHAMSGSISFSGKESRLREISGRLGQEVKFGEGVLGHLDPGGTFDVKQAEVAPGFWELTVLNVNMKGKALFFKSIDVQQKLARSRFKKLPDNLSLQSAAEMLERHKTAPANRTSH